MILKRRLFTNQCDIRMRENALYPTPQLRNDLGHTFTSLCERGGMDIGLRGNTTHIQASATHLRVLEDCDLQALFGSVFSGAVATRPRADDDKISCCH